jgi:hypothetical protein
VSSDQAPEAALEDKHVDAPLGAHWRVQAEATQQRALPAGSVVVSCGAPFGGGGLGRHLKEIVDALERNGQERSYICATNLKAQPGAALRLPNPTALLARFSPGRRLRKVRVEFDAAAARQLPQADQLMAFNRMWRASRASMRSPTASIRSSDRSAPT